jgi:hypothetical protein
MLKMPKNVQRVMNEINALPIDTTSQLVTNRARITSPQNDETPNYIRSESIQKAMGSSVVSLFGGADVTALKNS